MIQEQIWKKGLVHPCPCLSSLVNAWPCLVAIFVSPPEPPQEKIENLKGLFSGNLQEILRKSPGNSQEISRKFSGNLQEIFKKSPGNSQEISRKFSGTLQEIHRKSPGNSHRHVMIQEQIWKKGLGGPWRALANLGRPWPCLRYLLL